MRRDSQPDHAAEGSETAKQDAALKTAALHLDLRSIGLQRGAEGWRRIHEVVRTAAPTFGGQASSGKSGSLGMTD
jgi:hypothetical protein